MLVGLGVEVVARLGSPADRRAMMPSLAIFFTLFPLLAGLRLLPVLHYLGEHPRLVPLDDQITVGEAFKTWLLPMHERGYPGHPYVWDEYADYVGLVPVVIMLAGVAVAFVRRDEETRQRRIDLGLLVVLVWAALGNIPGPSLFGLLHELPIYKSLRVQSRFLGPAMVGFALVAVSALMAARRVAAERRLRPGLMKALVGFEVVLVLAIAIDVCATNAQRIQQGMDPALPRTPASADFYQAQGADYGRFPTFPVRGIGTRQCYVPLEWKPAPGIQDGKIPQQRVQPPEAGAATPRSWSPNAIAIDVQLKQPAVLIVNQNYETGWQASTGTVGAYLSAEQKQWTRPARGVGPATPPVGLLSVALPAGTHQVVLRHRPPGLGLGLLLALVGLGLAIAVLRGLTPARHATLSARLASRLFD